MNYDDNSLTLIDNLPMRSLKSLRRVQSASWPNLFSERLSVLQCDTLPQQQRSKNEFQGVSSMQSPGPFSPMFDMDLESGKMSRKSAAANMDRSFSGNHGDISGTTGPGSLRDTIKLCRASNSFEAQLAFQVQQLRRGCNMDIAMGLVDVDAMARELLARGYLVQLRDGCDKIKDSRSCLQNLRHRFIICLGYQGHSPAYDQYLMDPLIVDPRFKEQFLIAHPTTDYEAVLEAIPQVFVGTLSKLEAAVKVICREMTRAFQEMGLSLPPWRTLSATMSKWSPAQLKQLAQKLTTSTLPATGRAVEDSAFAQDVQEANPWCALKVSSNPQLGKCQWEDATDRLETARILPPLSGICKQGLGEDVDGGSGNGLTPNGVTHEGDVLRFTRKASAEFRNRVPGKKMKSLLAAALKNAPGREAVETWGRSVCRTGDDAWGRFTTVKWGGAGTGKAPSGGAALQRNL